MGAGLPGPLPLTQMVTCRAGSAGHCTAGTLGTSPPSTSPESTFTATSNGHKGTPASTSHQDACPGDDHDAHTSPPQPLRLVQQLGITSSFASQHVVATSASKSLSLTSTCPLSRAIHFEDIKTHKNRKKGKDISVLVIVGQLLVLEVAQDHT